MTNRTIWKKVSNSDTDAANTNTPSAKLSSPKRPEHETSQYFRVDTKIKKVTSLKLIKRTGEFIYLPYALHPVTNFTLDKAIKIVSEDHVVIIKGNNLDRLADWMGRQQVQWIKESKTRYSYGTDFVFVENISIRERE